MDDSRDLLTSWSNAELAALADGLLAPCGASKLNELLQKNAEGQLMPPEAQELDLLLVQIDQLNVLVARARFTQQRRAIGRNSS
jgi:hypothetical protein